MTHAIYHLNEPPPDTAIVNGLRAANCEISQTQSITETLLQIRSAEAANEPVVLVCEMDAGAISLLALLRENINISTMAPVKELQGGNHTSNAVKPLVPTMIYDRGGHDISLVIQAFHYGVRDYVLASAPDAERELAARLLAERCQVLDNIWNLYGTPRSNVTPTLNTLPPVGGIPREVASIQPVAPAPSQVTSNSPAVNHSFEWDASMNVIRCKDENIFVSPTEGRIFDMLARHRGCIVTTEDLIQHALMDPSESMDGSIERIRTHVMKLRRKLDSHAATSNRVVNVRGMGYMFM
jgi:DNA-binding response OmpR family regulator